MEYESDNLKSMAYLRSLLQVTVYPGGEIDFLSIHRCVSLLTVIHVLTVDIL